MPGLLNKKILEEEIVNYTIENKEEKINQIQNWQENLENIKGLNEVRLQNAFLGAIFEDILGYEDAPQKEEWTLDVEASTDVDASRPDGILGFYKWSDNGEIKNHKAVIELKGPQVSLEKDQKRKGATYKSPIDQAFSYTNKLDRCQWIIVSNFTEIRLYQVGRSKEHYEIFYLNELGKEEVFEKFYYLLCKDNLISKEGKSVTKRLTEATHKLQKDMSVEFYNLYKDTRINLFEHLKKYNEGIDPEVLLEKAQKFLDRIIFICFCEDKRLLHNDLLVNAIEQAKEQARKSYNPSGTPVWDEIRGVFRAVDKGDTQHNINAFDGGLFEYDKVLDELVIKDNFFNAIHDISNYNFDSEVDVNILGHIFEQSINDIEKLKSDIKDNEYDEKKSKRKKEGIYYTPQYITSYIVENAIGGYLEDVKEQLGYYNLPNIEDAGSDSWETRYTNQHLDFYHKYEEELAKIKILDPACGSGAFLNQAFDYLFEEHQWVNNQLDILKNSRLEKKKYNYLQMRLQSQKQRYKNILKNNLYGVDLNEESVEITKLSLWLKTANKETTLTNLDDNIKCGNSLIDNSEIAGNKAFNWEEEFPDIISNGGFDVVIGNPPYIFTRNQSFNEEEKRYFNNNYDLNTYQLNTYILFMEKGLNLLKEKGSFGYIVPNNWLTINSLKELRKYILNNMGNIQIINTYDKVFEDANVDNCLSIWQKSGSSKIRVGEYKNEIPTLIDIPKDFYNSNEDYIINISMAKKKEIKEILNHIEQNSLYLSETANVSTGLKAYQTGKGDPPQTDNIKEERVFHSNKKETPRHFPYLEGKDVNRYYIEWSGEYLKYGDWLAEPRYSVDFEKPRILVRQIPSKPPYCINAVYTEEKYLNDINSMIIYNFDKNISPLYILGILNSRLISFWFEFTFDKFQRDIYPQFKVNELRRFPINMTDDNELYNSITENVKRIMSFKNNFNELTNIDFNELIFKYTSENGKTLSNILEESNFKNKIYSGSARKIRNFTVNINTNIMTLYSDSSKKKKYELLKFEENDEYKRRYIKHYLENLEQEQLDYFNDNFEGNLLKRVLQITIPDYDKQQVVKRVVDEWEELKKQIKELKNDIKTIDAKIDEIIYEIYDLNEDEIEFIKE